MISADDSSREAGLPLPTVASSSQPAGKTDRKFAVAVFGCCHKWRHEKSSESDLGLFRSQRSEAETTLRRRWQRRMVSRAHDEEAYLTVDGQVGSPLETGDAIECCLGNYDVLLIKPPQKTFFDALRQKLKWGER